ncbi:extracellular tyrosine-protein kinase PKDCC-like, partial [Uloborus diversus]|uniref:extracellular tyrosine-protein kinase PKDCC-like n=1 Tax=Uloborus diversus TaxID=327109 RepID=UPI002409DEE8
MNIIRTGGHFIRHILPHGAPPQLRPLADRITAAFGLGGWSAVEFSEQMEKLTSLFKNGSYRHAELHFLEGFKKENHMDISPNLDYRCQSATTGYGCAVSVYDAEEAAEICSRDSNCKAFVMTGITTWT